MCSQKSVNFRKIHINWKDIKKTSTCPRAELALILWQSTDLRTGSPFTKRKRDPEGSVTCPRRWGYPGGRTGIQSLISATWNPCVVLLLHGDEFFFVKTCWHALLSSTHPLLGVGHGNGMGWQMEGTKSGALSTSNFWPTWAIVLAVLGCPGPRSL